MLITAKSENSKKFSERKGMKESPIMTINHKKKKNPLKLFLIVIIILLAGAGGYIWYLNATYSSDPIQGFKQLFGNCEDAGCLVQLDKPKEVCHFPPFCNPELPKTNNRTNILLIGIDTRENGNLQNTDTIMMISYDHIDKNAYMISIPRDTYVTFKNYFGNKESTKINAVYYLSGMIRNDPQKAMLGLSTVVSDVTGLQPHYTVLVTLKGFKEAIDTLGGLKIDIPENHTDAYPKIDLSKETQKTCKVVRIDGEYCQITFTKGEQTLNGEMALVYARSREFSSDYDRARRQHIVLSALKEQVVSTETLTNPQKVLELITTFKDSIKTSDYNLGDIIAGLNELKAMNRTVSIVLDPTFGGGGVFSAGSSEIGYVNRVKDSTYKTVKSELQEIYNYPLVYIEDPKIGVYVATTSKKYDKNYVKLLTDLKLPKLTFGSKNTIINQTKDITYVAPTTNSETSLGVSSSRNTSSKTSSSTSSQVTTLQTKMYGVYVLDYTNGLKSGTLGMLQTKYPELQIDPNITFKRRNNEDFAIIIFDNLPVSSSSSSSSD